ncbi:MAG: septum formation initiator family protein [Lachnospiraceae bacterium]
MKNSADKRQAAGLGTLYAIGRKRASLRASRPEYIQTQAVAEEVPRQPNAEERMAERVRAERMRRWHDAIRTKNIKENTKAMLREANTVSAPLTAVSVLSAALILISGLLFLNQRAALSAEMKNTAALAQEVQQLEEDNRALRQEIDSSINPAEIYEQAVNEHNMSVPDSTRILVYPVTTEDENTAVQGEEVP